MNSIELFAGAGGLGIGLHNAGFETQAVIEIDKNACNTLKKNTLFGDTCRVLETDVKKVEYGTFEPIDLVSGGPPCQPFSLGGKHQAYDDSRDMFPEAVRAISELRPKAFVFENVKGLLRKSFSSYFEYILLRLQYPTMAKKVGETWEKHLSRLEKRHTSTKKPELTYNVTFRLINAADFGVPQKRERVFIIGFRSDLDIQWSFPEPTHSEDALFWEKWITANYWKRHKLAMPPITLSIQKKVQRIQKKYGFFAPTLKPWLTVRDAIGDLPPPKPTGHRKVLNHEFRDGAKAYPGHTGSDIDEPSKTLKAGVHGVPGGENMVKYHDGAVRYFTVRESARIQTFPDNYVVEGAWSEAMRQIGNAVPVVLSQKIGMQVMQAIKLQN